MLNYIHLYVLFINESIQLAIINMYIRNHTVVLCNKMMRAKSIQTKMNKNTQRYWWSVLCDHTKIYKSVLTKMLITIIK